MAIKLGTADLAQYFNSDAYMKRPKKGFVTTLGQEMPQLRHGATNFFDLSQDTFGKFIGESESKDGDGTNANLRQARTDKIVYDTRVSIETYKQLQENDGLDAFLQQLSTKHLGRDFERDLDRIALYGKVLSTGTHMAHDYVLAKDSDTALTKVIAAASDSATDIDKALATAVAETDAEGIVLNNIAASKLSTIMNGNVAKYPGLGAFGQGTNLAGIPMVSTKTVGVMGDGGEVAIVGDINAIRWGLTDTADFVLHTAGNPDGKGDLGNTNEYLIRMEIWFALAIANHDALRIITTKAAAQSVNAK